ncbi:serine/threonine-protein phosphatase CPPED1 [Nilaparvata lugens]|uniref:serine/threonine-protein phosphatase CPPED1 n=1 Tax=Nilaparvata lugens TaxID=108931 RepID=UPI00193E4B2D|nr:serine/threonine-protein phosphatase CPPED1 [Nilaparvata lugens]XP_039285001.1 serine/threonine-protein phosphatase CPPED1 [Nilaparvata lugens]XP_039285002.1 serine/threonine-protein phosphatase CPPED1 [Nilaparvata lugens]XP_039285004.1 serine/threonine-protein phosphatase CPPED1 [Nilaparvata lugens]
MSSDRIKWKINTKDHKLVHFDEDSEKTWKGPFHFIQGADSQFGLIDRYILKLPNPKWEKEIALCEEAVRKVNAIRPKPKFFVICGDLCDAVPVVSPELRKQQEETFAEIFSKVDKEIPVVCVCGNHDCGDQPTVQSVNQYRNSFGDDYFSFWVGGVLFIVINSQYYADGSLVEQLVAEQELWIDEQLALSKNSKHGAILFQHIPWFLDDVEAKDLGYFAIPYDTRKRMLDKLVAGGVKYVFCGHYHRNSGGMYNGLEVIVTSAIGGQLGTDKSGFRIVKVNEEQVSHRYYGLEEVPKDVQ